MRTLPRWSLLALLTVAAPVHAADDDVIRMSRGSQKILSLPRLKRAVSADPKVLAARQLGAAQLLIEGVHAGKTTLTVWTGKDEKSVWVVEVSK